MKLMTVLGARPQFIKAGAVSRALRNFPEVREMIVHTGQHFSANMSDLFFEELELPDPHYHLEINRLTHGAMTGRMLEQIETILLKESPDAVMVYGDTNSTLAGALAARKLHIPVMHVEAGIRSFNGKMAEEINRILTDRMSQVLFCPSQTAVDNLLWEGFGQFGSSIRQPGDVMEDAALYYGPKALDRVALLDKLGLKNKDYVLCTLHRAENTDDPVRFQQIVAALNAISLRIPVVLPLHPRTQKLLVNHGLRLDSILLPPLGYLDMLSLLQHARIVLTDSGGLQKEAYFFSKFCLTLRDDTEWPELVTGGYNFLVGANTALILNTLEEVLSKKYPLKQVFFGGGMASEKIAEFIARFDRIP